MARKTRKRPAAAGAKSPTQSFQPRDVLLAGIGAVSLGRKQVAAAVADGAVNLDAWRNSARRAVKQAGQAAAGRLQALRKQAEAQAAPVRRQVEGLAREAGAQWRQRVAPALARLGVPVKAPKAKAKPRRAPARRKPAGRRKAA